jgi:hypothetical protein
MTSKGFRRDFADPNFSLPLDRGVVRLTSICRGIFPRPSCCASIQGSYERTLSATKNHRFSAVSVAWNPQGRWGKRRHWCARSRSLSGCGLLGLRTRCEWHLRPRGQYGGALRSRCAFAASTHHIRWTPPDFEICNFSLVSPFRKMQSPPGRA